jgi:hypothetical protein
MLLRTNVSTNRQTPPTIGPMIKPTIALRNLLLVMWVCQLAYLLKRANFPTKQELNKKLPARRHAVTFKLIFFIVVSYKKVYK